MAFVQADILGPSLLLRRASQRVFRSRRRLAFSTAMAFAAGYLLYAHIHATVYGMAVPVFTGALYAAAILVAGVAMCIFLPKLRFMIESLAVSRLLIAIAGFGLPELGDGLRGSPGLSAAVLIGVAAVLSKLVYGNWSARALHAEAKRQQEVATRNIAQARSATAKPDLAAFLLADHGANAHADIHSKTVAEQTLGMELMTWMDDTLGRSLDRMKDAQMERQAGPYTVGLRVRA